MRLFRLHDGKAIAISERSYRDAEAGGFGEASLQQFLAEHPDVIPGDQIDRDDPPKFLLVK